MDPVGSTRRRSSGTGGKGRGGSQLGLKTAALAAPSSTPTSSPMSAATTASLAAPPAVSFPTPPADPPPSAPTSSPGVPSSSSPCVPSSCPAVPSSFPVLPQGAGWGAIPPIFPSEHGVYPPGGFLSFFQQPQYPPQPQMHGQNFHLVGQISPPPPASAYGSATPQAAKQGTSTKETVNIDSDEDGAYRTVKKKYWTHEEEERLANAWLNASKDPIKGNDKKGDTFWKEVTDEFNKKGNGKPTREMNQLKIHWSRLKSSISDFNGYWTKVSKVNTSGYSDDMLEEEAQKMYAKRFGKRFSLVHWWKILKDESKLCAQFQESEKKSEIVDVPDEQLRPIGREAAKAEHSGKRKKGNVMEGIVILGDNIDKIVKVQEDRKVEREKVTEAQIQISNANLKAAKEHKEAKMFEVYSSLLNQDISNMSEDQKANRDRAIRKLEEKLFAD